MRVRRVFAVVWSAVAVFVPVVGEVLFEVFGQGDAVLVDGVVSITDWSAASVLEQSVQGEPRSISASSARWAVR